ncbi:hypothetical protein MNBD_GAMMA03-1931 [hydrothermal vent metagenome]|uniref:ApeI dehydratase-like domain-containing protein n=1 Tax=hydrothermal vent metagenome TaxID=652676 RepID=A0A3B0WFP2_9ZZZZ
MLLHTHFKISAQHPCLKGHFNNHPIVPGVVLLEQVESFTLTELMQWKIIELKQVKFIATVLPEERIEIEINLDKLNTHQVITFNLRNTLKDNTTLVATGKFQLSLI